LLADEVGLGQTIEAGLGLWQPWAGRTASGDECDLTLATTGADAQRILLLAAALVFSGCVAVGASRRRGAQGRVGNRSAH